MASRRREQMGTGSFSGPVVALASGRLLERSQMPDGKVDERAHAHGQDPLSGIVARDRHVPGFSLGQDLHSGEPRLGTG